MNPAEEDFFAGRESSLKLYEPVRALVLSIGPAAIRVTKSQIAFRRRIAFAWVWIPGMYLKRNDVPLVLTIGLRRRDASPRWKEVAEPSPERYVHHLELRSEAELDIQVGEWLLEAWDCAQ